MQYHCPKCKSTKLIPIAQGNGVRPDIPKSLITLIVAIFLLLLLVTSSLVMWIFSNGAGMNLQIATVVVFVITVGSGLMFWRDLPKFKISMQSFMQSQKAWKCRDCQHQWQN